jgi:hypothetical protein
VGLSWRVALLPYLEQVNLYKQFKLNEPWDSENNKKLLAKMPPTYRSPFAPKNSTKTYYQGFAGPGTMFEPGAKISLAAVPDGTSNTVAVAECGPAVEWSKPADLPYDPKKPLSKLELPYKNVLIVAMGDGSARALKPDIDETNLRHLIECADGNPIEIEKLSLKQPLGRGQIKSAEDVLKKNEKLIDTIAEQLREHQKLLVEAAKRKNPADPIKAIDLDRLARLHGQLQMAVESLKSETEQLRQELEKK